MSIVSIEIGHWKSESVFKRMNKCRHTHIPADCTHILDHLFKNYENSASIRTSHAFDRDYYIHFNETMSILSRF